VIDLARLVCYLTTRALKYSIILLSKGLNVKKSFLLAIGFISLIFVETRHYYTMFDHHLRSRGLRGPHMGRGGMIGN
jgi:hypothetical protein